uniref:G-protein coupled receptors family 2 profile 2 domain-containing protein n=1 Tax=Timema monikensis TaxID=170555 RepID=A0A7R9EJK8_9NEOP|nr:unnamed protein product [Timema monikensis]
MLLFLGPMYHFTLAHQHKPTVPYIRSISSAQVHNSSELGAPPVLWEQTCRTIPSAHRCALESWRTLPGQCRSFATLRRHQPHLQDNYNYLIAPPNQPVSKLINLSTVLRPLGVALSGKNWNCFTLSPFRHMADPSIQTFCCHQPNNPDSVVNIMKEFNSEAYNTVCLVSSSIGIVGAVYQILPRTEMSQPHRWFSFSASRGRQIIVWLAIADLLASLGVFIRSALWLNNSENSMPAINGSGDALFCALTSLKTREPFCYVKVKVVCDPASPDFIIIIIIIIICFQPVARSVYLIHTFPDNREQNLPECRSNSHYHRDAWIQYFYTVTWFWTLCYALDMRLLLKDKPGYPHWYHMTSWLVPALLTSLGLTILYLPDADCHDIMSLGGVLLRILPNYCATYLPMLAVMLINPVLYVLSSRDVELIIVRYLSQFTDKERSMVDSVRIKFSLINVVFYICWLPNLINGILLWTLWFNLPVNIIIGLWYIMAVLNPLQALFNSLVYRRWSGATERVYIPFRKLQADDPSMDSSTPPLELASETTGEDTPLLQSREFSHRRLPRAPINGSSGSF